MQQGPGNKNVNKLVWRLFWESLHSLGCRYYLFLFAILSFALVSLLPAQVLKYFTANLLQAQSGVPREFLFALAGFGMIVALALWISRAGSALCQEWLRVSLESKLRLRILSALHSTSLLRLETAQRGDWYSRVTGDLSRVEGFLTDAVPSQIRILTILVGTAVLFFLHSGPIALLPLAAAASLAWLNFYFQGRLAPRLRELRELHGGVFQELVENFEGIRTIRSHRSETFVQARFARQLAHLKSRSLNVVRVVGALMGTNEFASQAFITLCLTVITIALSEKTLGLDEALLYPFYLGMFCSAATDLARSAYDWNRFFIEGSRVAEFLYAPVSTGPGEALPIGDVSKLVVRDVLVGHGVKALRPAFDFSIEASQLVFVTGPSGCGKSTFLEILAGLRPALAGTVDLASWKLPLSREREELRDLFAYVEQRPYLFEGSLRENLTLGVNRADELLWEALEGASIADFFRHLGGLEFRVHDRGENLSEGQRFRIALGRAFLLGRPFLLLDEPFSSIDPATTAAVTRALNRKRSEGMGIVVVSHQAPVGLDVDKRIDFMELGKEFPAEAGIDGAKLVGSPIYN